MVCRRRPRRRARAKHASGVPSASGVAEASRFRAVCRRLVCRRRPRRREVCCPRAPPAPILYPQAGRTRNPTLPQEKRIW